MSVASPSKTVLITGINGFTGQHLRQHLQAAGWRVVGTDRAVASENGDFSADLTNPEQLRTALQALRPDYIVHLAAISFVAHGNPLEMYETNLFGTLNLLDAVLAAGIAPRKLLIASSANVYGNPPTEVIDEEVCPAPVNHYAMSKLAMEHMVRTYQERLPLLITRPFNYSGPGQGKQFLIPKIVDHYRRRQPFIELGNLQVVREFSDIRLVVEVYRRLLESAACGETVNVCSGVGVALADVIAKMNALAGYTIEVRVNPELVRANEIPRLIGDKRKLQRLVGTLPNYSLDDLLGSMYHASS